MGQLYDWEGQLYAGAFARGKSTAKMPSALKESPPPRVRHAARLRLCRQTSVARIY